jgi:hypothetical protein
LDGEEAALVIIRRPPHFQACSRKTMARGQSGQLILSKDSIDFRPVTNQENLHLPDLVIESK